ncbi:ABC transporter substrate-binding protein [Microlunatus sp. GCM10028923]|uniref:ABC transporter substrate-binding protein n=1 Tax=Microlunatus sp. GCM10028923 TaxID=3273400 RepID=UPI003606672F
MSRNRVAGAIGLLLAASLSLAACTEAAPPEDENPGGPVQLSVFAPQGATTNLAENAFSKQMAEKFGIEFSWETTTWDAGAAAEKRQISLASGDYPDLFLLIPWVDQFKPTELMKLGQQGVAMPLNDLIKEHAPNIQAELDANPDYRAMSTAPDGNIYGLGQWIDCYHCSYPGKLWLNTDWLEKLNLERPTSTEELRTVLQAFKTKDPNGNGKADEVPLSSAVGSDILPYFMGSFIAGVNNKSTVVLKDGQVDIQADKEGWREGLRYLHQLMEEGLIDKGALSQNQEALQKLADNPGDVILGGVPTLHPRFFVTLEQKDKRDAGYNPIPPLKGPQGLAYASYAVSSTPGATFVLTNKASERDKIAAIKMLDYLFTDQGETEGVFGVEGKDWEKPGSGDKPLVEGVPALYKVLQTPENTAWQPLAQYRNTREYRGGQVVPDDIYSTAGYERRLQEATKLYEGSEDRSLIFPFHSVWVAPENASELATLQTNIESYIAQSSVEFMTGSKNLDTDWDSYVAGFEGMGLPRYKELLQTSYRDSAPR